MDYTFTHILCMPTHSAIPYSMYIAKTVDIDRCPDNVLHMLLYSNSVHDRVMSGQYAIVYLMLFGATLICM